MSNIGIFWSKNDVILWLDLRKELQTCVEKAIPVISVTAVIGSTEESAIDPLTEILDIREEFKKKVCFF
jgi:glutamate/tyrosine decarboxylase-like PLP-dependent enzyme